MEFRFSEEQMSGYDRWATLRLWKAACEFELNEYKPVLSRFSHILAARAIWAARITGNTIPAEVWPEEPPDSVENKLNAADPMRILLSNDSIDPDQIVTYRNSSGNKFSTRLADIIQHVTIHGQHHRAQIAMIMRNKGFIPPATDYIFYLRSVK